VVKEYPFIILFPLSLVPKVQEIEKLGCILFFGIRGWGCTPPIYASYLKKSIKREIAKDLLTPMAGNCT